MRIMRRTTTRIEEVGKYRAKNLNKRVALRFFKPDILQTWLRFMEKIESVHEMRSLAAQFKQSGKTIALVPTSGALHAGHAALITTAEERADTVVVSVFANPLAFGPSENFARYPRSPDADVRLCEELQVDVVFM